jgi:hypothetical protein
MLADRAGVTLIVYALALPALLGFTGLAVEVGEWHALRTSLQSAADAGALAGAWELKAGGTAAQAVTAAKEAIAKNSVIPDAITVNTPPDSGPYAGNDTAVQVLVQKKQLPLFSKLFNISAFDIGTGAVATMHTTEQACVLGLDPSASSSTVSVNGNSDITFGNCVLAADSSNPTDAIYMSGNTQFTAQSIAAVGNIEVTGQVTTTLTQPAQTGITPILDPFRNLNITSPATCDYTTTQTYSTTTDAHPGTYCGGITINKGVSVTFEPGTYYIDGGNFQVNGGANVQCDCSAPGSGVTFVLTNYGGSGTTGTVQINGTATVNLQAPTDTTDSTEYPYPGMLFVQDRNAPAGQVSTFNGNANSSLKGALYFPNSITQLNGDFSNTTNCTELVAWQVVLNGNVGDISNYTTNSACAASQINPVNITDVQLVE